MSKLTIGGTATHMTYRICGVQVSRHEHEALDNIRLRGICLYCGRSGMSNRYGNAKRHVVACQRGLTLLEIEKRLSARLAE